MGDKEAADKRMGEQFRKEFLEVMEMLQPAGQPKAPGEMGRRGPKLGDSHSARAAMRERELAAKRKKAGARK
jgi:hypothetical protein